MRVLSVWLTDILRLIILFRLVMRIGEILQAICVDVFDTVSIFQQFCHHEYKALITDYTFPFGSHSNLLASSTEYPQ